MTTFYLIRHGSNDFLGRALAGRLPAVHLNEHGREEAGRIAEQLRKKPIRHIFTSPLARCRETAEPLAAALGLRLEISEALNEVDFGDWEGAEMKALDADEHWRRWNAFRSGHQPPRGEMMIAIQARMANEMVRLKNSFPDEHLALVSHGDPIRAVLCYWLGMPLDFLPRMEIAPGSVSIVAVGDQSAVVHALNLS